VRTLLASLAVAMSLAAPAAEAATRSEVIAQELGLAQSLGFKVTLDDGCPNSQQDTMASARRKFEALAIPIENGRQSYFSLVLDLDCLEQSDGYVVYSGAIELYMPIILPTQLLAMQDGREDWNASELSVWSTTRFGSLGAKPASLQSRALYDEVDRLIDQFNVMWQRSRKAYGG
jgi:hypothetical protein